MKSNLEKEEALALGKKALKDIGHWENFRLEDARFISEKHPVYDFKYWYVWFNF